MYGLAVNLIVSVSGHPWIIDEILCKRDQIKKHYSDLTSKLVSFFFF